MSFTKLVLISHNSRRFCTYSYVLRALKSWMASRAGCAPQPKFLAIRGACSLLELAQSIWERRKVKASFERSPASRRSRSSFESVRMKTGDFMAITVTHNPRPTLDVH